MVRVDVLAAAPELFIVAVSPADPLPPLSPPTLAAVGKGVGKEGAPPAEERGGGGEAAGADGLPMKEAMERMRRVAVGIAAEALAPDLIQSCRVEYAEPTEGERRRRTVKFHVGSRVRWSMERKRYYVQRWNRHWSRDKVMFLDEAGRAEGAAAAAAAVGLCAASLSVASP
eukprot:gene1862-15737_t